jgi:hypothetical protein
LADYIYVIEIKVQRGASDSAEAAGAGVPAQNAPVPDNPALAQIQACSYSAKYRGLSIKGLFEVGLVFDSQARNLVQADWVAIDPA